MEEPVAVINNASAELVRITPLLFALCIEYRGTILYLKRPIYQDRLGTIKRTIEEREALSAGRRRELPLDPPRSRRHRLRADCPARHKPAAGVGMAAALQLAQRFAPRRQRVRPRLHVYSGANA